MSNQTSSRKISSFVAGTTIPSSAKFTYVSGGVNYQIDISDFQTSLGVTGSIEQTGDSTGLPILQTSGSVNKIRNLENGAGITTSVSPLNGAKISQNIVNGSGGVDIIESLTAAQILHRNIKAGSGINVSIDGTDDAILIAASGVAASTKTVIVSSLTDLPAATSNVITLADDTDYLFVNDISTSDRFSVPNNTTLRGVSSTLIVVTYTGAGNMFTVGSASNFKCQNLAFTCATGSLLNGTGAGTGQVQFVECRVVSCSSLGSIGDMFLIRFDRVAFAAINTSGLTITGANTVLFFDGCYIFLNGGTYLDLGTATFNDVSFRNQFLITSAGGTTFLSGAAASANINSGGQGLVTGCSTSGSATLLSGIATTDALWNFSHNDDIADTRTDGLLSMATNATNTVIAVTSTPVLVAGTWVIESVGQMTGTTAGRLTYNGGKDTTLPVVASLSCEPATGGSITIGVQIAINGTVVANSKREGTASGSNPTSITMPWQVELSMGDYIEMFVSNESSTSDILVSSATFLVN